MVRRPSDVMGRRGSCAPWRAGLAAILVLVLVLLGAFPSGRATDGPAPDLVRATTPFTNSSPVANFSSSIGRLVDLLGVAGSGLLALVWARVALSWFSHDVTKKVLAKDRARDALIGTLLFIAALTGLVWGLAHWVLTGV
ncbi:MAG: hypothetical protein WA691_07330 [Thermoplasmata archaeon]